MARIKTDEVMQKLRDAGYNPTFVESSGYDIEDDGIDLTDKINIQLCMDGVFGLSVDEGDGEFMIYPYVDTIEEVLDQIKEFKVTI